MTLKRLSLVLIATALSIAPAARADEYAVEPSHAHITFKISHVGLSWTFGRFKDVSGTFAIDTANPSASKFDIAAKADSIDTDNAKRDEHLRSPDFFNTKQFPGLTFKSTAVKPTKTGYEVTGDLTLHGVKKSVTLNLIGGKVAEFPKGVQRTGYSADFTIKRSEFGMDKMLEAIGDEVFVSASFEGTKPKQ